VGKVFLVNQPKKAAPVRRMRLVPRTRKDKVSVVRIGQTRRLGRDIYVSLLMVDWLPLIVIIGTFYLLSNLAFAAIYYHTASVENATKFSDYFFFSVQTMATIGYGKMSPVGDVANLAVTVEAFFGFTFFAFVTGLAFSKFSRPTAHVMFTDVAVVSDYNGKRHLKIRLANQRHNRIVNAKVSLYLLKNIQTAEGFQMRTFQDLKLVRDHIPLMALTWTVMHHIDQESPLSGINSEQLCENEDEIIVSLTGVDETMAQTIHAHHSYLADEVLFDSFFEDVVTRKDGHVEINYRLFHAVRTKEDTEKLKALNGK